MQKIENWQVGKQPGGNVVVKVKVRKKAERFYGAFRIILYRHCLLLSIKITNDTMLCYITLCYVRTAPNSERNRPAFDIDRLSKIVPVGRSLFKTDQEISLNHYLKLRRGLIKHHRPLIPHNWDTNSGLPRPQDYEIAVNVDSKHTVAPPGFYFGGWEC